MPLASGNNPKVIAKNVATERAAGKPEAQAVAIALHEAKDGDPNAYPGVATGTRVSGSVYGGIVGAIENTEFAKPVYPNPEYAAHASPDSAVPLVTSVKDINTRNQKFWKR